MFHLAGHRRKSSCAERLRSHPIHFGLDASPNDDELFRSRVVVPRDQTIWWSFQDEGGRPFGWISVLYSREKTLDVVIGVELDSRERPNDAMVLVLRLRKARESEQQDREPKSSPTLQF